MMKCRALFLLATAALSGCISDSSENSVVVLQYKRLFEIGRRAEKDGNFKMAEDTYRWLVGRGSHYGEYGLAALLQRLHPDGKGEAVNHLLSCARYSNYTSLLSSDAAMDFAFSAAAMAKLADIAANGHDRPDVADSLRCMMSRIVTKEVRAWANAMKTNNEDSATIYGDVICAVESCRPHSGYLKGLEWDEISRVYLNVKQGNIAPIGKNGRSACIGTENRGEQTKGKAG